MLRPYDLAVLLYLLLHPRDPYSRIASMLGIGKSTAHAAMARLVNSGLAHQTGNGAAEAAWGPTREFLLHGAAYAFPPQLIARARGVPTGLSAPLLRSYQLVGYPTTVWPSHLGDSVGRGVKPLVPAAPDTALRDPQLYHLLALFDALRLADARERDMVREELSQVLAATRK